MGTPTKKRTSGQRKRRASHFGLKDVQLTPNAKGKLVPQRYKQTQGKLDKAKAPSKPKQANKKA